MPSFQFRKMRCYGHIGYLLRQIVVGSLAGARPSIRDALEVTIKSLQTYMSLTDVFFKGTFVVDL